MTDLLIPRGHASVMAGRVEPRDSLDHFPTPPWATRALVEELFQVGPRPGMTAWEPACGDGAMVKPLREYGFNVVGSDVHNYGRGFPVIDFLADGAEDALPWRPEMIVTNPPFNKALDFALKALEVATKSVALFVRLSWIEGAERHRRLFTPHPPSLVCPFVERVVLAKGELRDPAKLYWDEAAGKWRKPSSATAYAWFVWLPSDVAPAGTRVQWIPPCRRQLEREGDYGPLEDLFSREA